MRTAYPRPSSVVFGVILAMFCCAVFAGLENAQKIGEIKGQGESFLTFLSRLPASFEAQIFYAVALFGLVGMMANYSVKWMRGEIAGSLISYLFLHNIRATLLSYATTIGVGIGAITAGVFETGSGEFVGWFNVMWVSLTNGYMWDAALNAGQRAVWSPEKRQEEQAKTP